MNRRFIIRMHPTTCRRAIARGDTNYLKGRDFMKKKSILPLVTVTMLATALLGGCANNTETTTTS